MLYPLKFKPRFKERIWGGRELEKLFDKKLPKGQLIGESWEVSTIESDESVVSNGLFKGNTLGELIEIYMYDMVGDAVFEKFGEELPLLVKFIDAHQQLSVQVHPCNEIAATRHNAYGKTEMWYVINNQPDAFVYLGFNKEISKRECLALLECGNIEGALQKYEVKRGDIFFIPPGTVHAIGQGVMVVEIQQASDVTYRLFDYNRLDDQGNKRELHVDLALDIIDFSIEHDYKIEVEAIPNKSIGIQSCQYFASALTWVDGNLERNYESIDSFVVYTCIEGSCQIVCENGEIENIKCGETILLPSVIDGVMLKGKARMLESWVP